MLAQNPDLNGTALNLKQNPSKYTVSGFRFYTLQTKFDQLE